MLLSDEYWPFRLCVALCRGECKWSTFYLKSTLASSARPSCPKHSDDPQAAPRSLVLLAMLVASGESSPSVSSRLAPRTHDRPSDPARSSVWFVVPWEGVLASA